MVFKCLNNLAPEYFSGCFSKLTDCHNRGLGNSKTDLLVPCGQKSFAYHGAKAWNELDFESQLASSIHCFNQDFKHTRVSSMDTSILFSVSVSFYLFF